VRGINSSSKWNAIRNKVQECSCDIICLQETKRDSFDPVYLKNFCPPSFDSFDYIPAEGTSGGNIIIWKSNRFNGQTIFQNNYALSIEFTSTISGASWILTNIYTPCTHEGRADFLSWFSSIDMHDESDWLIVGDFNLIRRASDRNRLGGNLQDMLGFNSAISSLGLEELKLYGNKYTWMNKQQSPILERLDWFFASASWLMNYPGSSVQTLSRDVSDHSPCVVTISTDIPKAKVFSF
jgi:exonuclease III